MANLVKQLTPRYHSSYVLFPPCSALDFPHLLTAQHVQRQKVTSASALDFKLWRFSRWSLCRPSWPERTQLCFIFLSLLLASDDLLCLIRHPRWHSSHRTHHVVRWFWWWPLERFHLSQRKTVVAEVRSPELRRCRRLGLSSFQRRWPEMHAFFHHWSLMDISLLSSPLEDCATFPKPRIVDPPFLYCWLSKRCSPFLAGRV